MLIVLGILNVERNSNSILGGGISTDLVSKLSTTTQIVVNTTATQVFSRGQLAKTLYRALDVGTSTATFTCAADDQTAPSSSVAVGANGWTIGNPTPANASNTVTLPSKIELGRCPTCMPFFGAVNCIASAQSRINVLEAGLE